MSEQTTPKVDEIKPEEQVAAASTTEASVKDQVEVEAKSSEVSSAEKATENGKVEAEKVVESNIDESASAVSTTEQVASSDDKVEKPVEEKKPSEVDEKSIDAENSKEVPQVGTEQQQDGQPAVIEANGKHPSEEVQEKISTSESVAAPVDESNGVCKRKTENGAEAVEDEKTPKKAKVVSDGDQAPVEETAA